MDSESIVDTPDMQAPPLASKVATWAGGIVVVTASVATLIAFGYEPIFFIGVGCFIAAMSDVIKKHDEIFYQRNWLDYLFCILIVVVAILCFARMVYIVNQGEISYSKYAQLQELINTNQLSQASIEKYGRDGVINNKEYALLLSESKQVRKDNIKQTLLNEPKSQ